jgi:biopolymer transport protein ExbD
MAEVQRKIITNKTGIRKSKKHSTRVDLTPMVDLGFLLITFFVFTTSLSTPTAMRLILPKDTKDSSFTAANKTISLLLTGSNTIYYYNGDSVNNMHVTTSANEIRNILQQKKARVQQQYNDAGEMVALIKPTDDCTFSNLVNTLDEMQINVIKRYVLINASEVEKSMMH